MPSPRHHLVQPLRPVQPLHRDRLHRAGRRGPQDPQALGVVGVEVVEERLLPVQLENGGREKDALRVPLAPIQVDDDSHEPSPFFQPCFPVGLHEFFSRVAGLSCVGHLPVGRCTEVAGDR
jgi:hypothetical protein